MSAYTPGPWKVEEDYRVRAGVFVILIGNREGSLRTEWRANACLIASAPELLEALHGMLKLIGDGQLRRNTSDDPEPNWELRQVPFVEAMAKATQAIEKAEGRQ
jgi:hypothetical protein